MQEATCLDLKWGTSHPSAATPWLGGSPGSAGLLPLKTCHHSHGQVLKSGNDPLIRVPCPPY